jgi:ADP-dependent phosphofructokinase/glucokinase
MAPSCNKVKVYVPSALRPRPQHRVELQRIEIARAVVDFEFGLTIGLSGEPVAFRRSDRLIARSRYRWVCKETRPIFSEHRPTIGDA